MEFRTERAEENTSKPQASNLTVYTAMHTDLNEETCVIGQTALENEDSLPKMIQFDIEDVLQELEEPNNIKDTIRLVPDKKVTYNFLSSLTVSMNACEVYILPVIMMLLCLSSVLYFFIPEYIGNACAEISFLAYVIYFIVMNCKSNEGSSLARIVVIFVSFLVFIVNIICFYLAYTIGYNFRYQ